jgi:diguanylate cyclase (GGDEF)-like protein
MENRSLRGVLGDPRDAVGDADQFSDGAQSSGRPVADLLDSAAEKAARERLFDEVLAGVELVLNADGVAFWREEPDHTLQLTSSKSMSRSMLHALDRNVTTPLQSIMQRWPDSPLVAVPLNDPANAIAEEIRAICELEGVSSLAGVPCRISGEMLGMLIVTHRGAHSWTVRDLGLATGFAGQLATAMQNAHLYASVRSLASRLAAIHELSLRLAQLRDVDAIGEAIVAEVGRLVDCDTVRVYRLDPEAGVFRPVAASGRFLGIDAPPLEALSSGPGETLPGWVAKRNEPLIVPDASVERRSIFRSTFGPESLLLVPMSYANVVQGVLAVSKEGANRYGPDDEQALSIFGRYAAQAIVNADNVERLERQQALLERQIAAERRLLDVSEQLVSTLEPRRVLDQIADTIGSVVRFDQLTIYRLGENGRIEAVLTRSGAAAGDSAFQPAMDEGLTSWVIGRGDAVCANDVAEGVLAVGPDGIDERDDESVLADVKRDARSPSAAQKTQNIIVVPLRTHGEVVGSLNLLRLGGPEAHFGEQEFELSKLFAGQASMALQNAEAHVTLASRADLDALTGLRNHGTFQRDLDTVVEAGNPFSLLMLDLDSFKAYNDTFGHPAGDALLQIVAAAIVGAIRQNDRAYRYGGDEFALLLLGANRTHAAEVAERVRTAVRKAVIGSPGHTPGLVVSASIGAAHWPADGLAKADIVLSADQELYHAKRQRGQRSATPEPPAQAEKPTPSDCDRGAGFVPGSLLEAAYEMLSASGLPQIAEVTLRHAAKIVGAEDGFVAMLDSPDPGSPPRGGSRRAAMRLLAGRGAFETRKLRIRRGTGFWGRVWQEATLLEDGSSGGIGLVGVPLIDGERVVGLVGLVAPDDKGLTHDHLHQLGHVAALASAATTAIAERAEREISKQTPTARVD